MSVGAERDQEIREAAAHYAQLREEQRTARRAAENATRAADEAARAVEAAKEALLKKAGVGRNLSMRVITMGDVAVVIRHHEARDEAQRDFATVEMCGLDGEPRS